MTTSLSVVKASTLDFRSFQTTVGLITPEVAAQLLERNFEHNRNVASPTIRRYARLMKEQRWGISDPIKFAEDGTLIDGQHRLNAVIQSGSSVPFVIMTGYPKESCELLDQGRSRNVQNIINLRGSKTTSNHVSIVRMAIIAGETGSNLNVKFSPSEVADLVEFFQDRLDFALSHSGVIGAIRTAPVLVVPFMAYDNENHDRLNDFVYCWHTGTVRHGKEDNAAILLRNIYLTKYKDITYGAGLPARISLFRKTQSALSYFLKGECPKHFKDTTKVLWGAETFSPKNIKKILESK